MKPDRQPTPVPPATGHDSAAKPDPARRLDRWLDADPLRCVLLAFATETELRGALGTAPVRDAAAGRATPWPTFHVGPRTRAVVTGVGKANAAAAVAALLARLGPDESGRVGVISVGIAGALPITGGGLGGAEPALPIGAVVVGTASAWGDEGVQTPDRFDDCWRMGFPLADTPTPALPADAQLLAAFTGPSDAPGPIPASGVIATVSTCSGVDALARAVVARSGAVAEAMEGAAVLQTARRWGAPAIEVRAISNTTGDRPGQRWDVPLALASLRRILGRS